MWTMLKHLNVCHSLFISLLCQYRPGPTLLSEINGDVQIYQIESFSSVDNAGRVEICMSGVWGTIAADSLATPWSEKNAQVACIKAGFSGVLNVILQKM